MNDARLAVSATGLLADFNRAGALGWADVHPAQLLGHLFAESDQRVLLALALTVRALRSGSICLPLDRLTTLDAEEGTVDVPSEWWPDAAEWEAALRASPAVGVGESAPGDRPLRLVDGALYLERHFDDQEAVRRALLARLAQAPSSGTPEGQEAAVDLALTSPVTIIAGGPGTGKTWTIRRIIHRLQEVRPDALLALAAPTGKAAARMTESLGDTELTALTLHSLLGWAPGGLNRFAHHAGRPLPHDVVIVDEMSMVSMVLMRRLLDALKPSAQLVLVGDPDQLTSVDAGSVLADLTRAPATTGVVARLTHNYRFAGDIQRVATAIAEADADAALAVLTASGSSARLVAPVDAGEAVRSRVVDAGRRVFAAASDGDAAAALAALDEHRLLCGHRAGPFGVAQWARHVASWLADAVPGYQPGEYSPGRPVLVTANRPELGLHNGDTGVILADGPRALAWFRVGGRLRSYSPMLLDGLTTLHAMTVHKAQGSQFDHVSVVLPPSGSPLLTRELLYTALSRARSSVVVVGDEAAVREAIARPARRMSGLADRLA